MLAAIIIEMVYNRKVGLISSVHNPPDDPENKKTIGDKIFALYNHSLGCRSTRQHLRNFSRKTNSTNRAQASLSDENTNTEIKVSNWMTFSHNMELDTNFLDGMRFISPTPPPPRACNFIRATERERISVTTTSVFVQSSAHSCTKWNIFKAKTKSHQPNISSIQCDTSKH